MGRLSDDLREMGFVTTGRESPVDDDGTLWTNGKELVCDETGTVIDGDHHGNHEDSERTVHRYRNSGNVKLIGGYLSNYFD